MVYDDAEKYYAEVKKDGEAMLEEAFKVLFPKHSSSLTSNAGGALVGYNSTFIPRREVVRVENAASFVGQLAQTAADGTGYALMDAPEGATVARPIGMFADCMPVSGMFGHTLLACDVADQHEVFTNGTDHLIMRNSSVQLTIAKGRITSLRDVRLEYVPCFEFFSVADTVS
jgi:alpha-mannosidase